MFAIPDGIIKVNDYLFVKDRKTNPILHVFDASNRGFLQSFGKQGKGPGEFLVVSGMNFREDQQKLWLHDGTLKRIQALDLNQMDTYLSQGEIELNEMKQLNVDAIVDMPRWLTDSTLVGMNLYGDGKQLVYFHKDGQLLKKSGTLPPLVPPVPDRLINSIYSGNVSVNPSRDRVVVASVFADLLNVYDQTGQQVLSMRGPEGFSPELELVKVAGMDGLITAIGEKTRVGYQDVFVSDRYIYLLYSGRKYDRDYPLAMATGDIIYILSLTGQPVMKLKLDHRLRFFTVDERQGMIYGIGEIDDLYDVVTYTFKPF
ncbi:MAG: BF3164 family lipoprotein [Bacteroidota bacterium]